MVFSPRKVDEFCTKAVNGIQRGSGAAVVLSQRPGKLDRQGVPITETQQLIGIALDSVPTNATGLPQ